MRSIGAQACGQRCQVGCPTTWELMCMTAYRSSFLDTVTSYHQNTGRARCQWSLTESLCADAASQDW